MQQHIHAALYAATPEHLHVAGDRLPGSSQHPTYSCCVPGGRIRQALSLCCTVHRAIQRQYICCCAARGSDSRQACRGVVSLLTILLSVHQAHNVLVCDVYLSLLRFAVFCVRGCLKHLRSPCNCLPLLPAVYHPVSFKTATEQPGPLLYLLRCAGVAGGRHSHAARHGNTPRAGAWRSATNRPLHPVTHRQAAHFRIWVRPHICHLLY